MLLKVFTAADLVPDASFVFVSAGKRLFMTSWLVPLDVVLSTVQYSASYLVNIYFIKMFFKGNSPQNQKDCFDVKFIPQLTLNVINVYI